MLRTGQPSPHAQRETIVADSLPTLLDAYDLTRLLMECCEPPALGMAMMFGVPMDARMVLVGAKGPVQTQQVRDESTNTDLWVMSTVVRVLGERERRGVSGPQGATFTALELGALIAHMNRIDAPGVRAFFRSVTIDGRKVLHRYEAAMRALPDIEQWLLGVLTAAWKETDDLGRVRTLLDHCLGAGPISDAIAERRAAGAGGATLH